jgi:hypothetical protein
MDELKHSKSSTMHCLRMMSQLQCSCVAIRGLHHVVELFILAFREFGSNETGQEMSETRKLLNLDCSESVLQTSTAHLPWQDSLI